MCRVELGISYKEFYSMTWYDCTGCIEQIYQKRKNHQEDQEVLYDVCRRMLAQYWNWNRGEKNQPVEPEDFWKLSFDKPTDTQANPEDEEKLRETIRRLEKVNKRKRG